MKIKKIMSFLLAAVMLAGILTPAGAQAENAEEFVPVIRFIAASDTHVQTLDRTTADRIGKMMDLAYDIAESDPNYKKLDALIVAGDLTDRGLKRDFDLFASTVKKSLRGDTRFLGVVAKNHDGRKMSREEERAYYTEKTGNSPDFYEVINGYRFIGLSASPDDSKHYDEEQLAWLDSQLAKAATEEPDKPVFVFHHEHNSNTVYGSSDFEGWGVPFFGDILKNYPQVVDFSGHSHYPLNDPRSIWQGEYTALGTGAIYYSEFTIDDTRTYHPDDSHDTATFWICELDAANRLRLRGMDLLAKECIVEYILDNPADPGNREYTCEKREEASKPPVFDDGAALEITAKPGGCEIKAPAAKSADGMPVVLYRAKAAGKDGQAAATWTLPSYYLAGGQDSVTLTLTGLEKGEYEISVVAENAYGGDSEPLTAQVSVSEDGCPYCGGWHEGFEGFFTAIFHRIAYFFEIKIPALF